MTLLLSLSTGYPPNNFPPPNPHVKVNSVTSLQTVSDSSLQLLRAQDLSTWRRRPVTFQVPGKIALRSSSSSFAATSSAMASQRMIDFLLALPLCAFSLLTFLVVARAQIHSDLLTPLVFFSSSLQLYIISMRRSGTVNYCTLVLVVCRSTMGASTTLCAQLAGPREAYHRI